MSFQILLRSTPEEVLVGTWASAEVIDTGRDGLLQVAKDPGGPVRLLARRHNGTWRTVHTGLDGHRPMLPEHFEGVDLDEIEVSTYPELVTVERLFTVPAETNKTNHLNRKDVPS